MVGHHLGGHYLRKDLKKKGGKARKNKNKENFWTFVLSLVSKIMLSLFPHLQ